VSRHHRAAPSFETMLPFRNVYRIRHAVSTEYAWYINVVTPYSVNSSLLPFCRAVSSFRYRVSRCSASDNSLAEISGETVSAGAPQSVIPLCAIFIQINGLASDPERLSCPKWYITHLERLSSDSWFITNLMSSLPFQGFPLISWR